MRYRRENPDVPWPLSERLWETRRGLLHGIAMSAFVYTPIYVLAYAAKSRFHWTNTFVILLADWRFILILVAATVWRMWANEIDLVNEDSITSEEKLEMRIRILETRVENLTSSRK